LCARRSFSDLASFSFRREKEGTKSREREEEGSREENRATKRLTRNHPFFRKNFKQKSSQWVFFIGPFAGAIAAAYVYELGFKPDYDGLIDLEGGGSETAAAAGPK